jgi:hypothetical protein
MGKFAYGKKAYGISDRSGFRYRLRDMKKEWNGALVGPDEYESKHPQLESPRIISDPQALREPRPDNTEVLSVFLFTDTVGIPTTRLISFGQVGEVTVTT